MLSQTVTMNQIDHNDLSFKRKIKNCLIFIFSIILFVVAINVGIGIINNNKTSSSDGDLVDIVLGGSGGKDADKDADKGEVVDGDFATFSDKAFLGPNDSLRRGQYITSPSGNYSVGLTVEGDLVLQDSRLNLIWSANTREGVGCYMQDDGNLVIRNKFRKSLWSSQTSKHDGSKLVVDDGGRVNIIYGTTVIWMQGIPSGKYTSPSSNDLIFPVRGAFYYAWYPETWKVSSGALARFEPDLGYYNSGDPVVVTSHINSLEYGNIDLGIISWWGPSTNLDRSRITLIMDETLALKSKIKWTIYYEDEMKLNPTISQIKVDLEYLKKWFAWKSTWAHVDGKPLIFLYNDSDCDIVKRWMEATEGEWYVIPKVFSNFDECPVQPNAWHQYGPAGAFLHHKGYSVSISPGFWKADHESPRLPRLNESSWCQNVQAMVDSGEPWQLITTFNEHGEGTPIEPSSANWPSKSGYGYYLDCLHDIAQ